MMFSLAVYMALKPPANRDMYGLVFSNDAQDPKLSSGGTLCIKHEGLNLLAVYRCFYRLEDLCYHR